MPRIFSKKDKLPAMHTVATIFGFLGGGFLSLLNEVLEKTKASFFYTHPAKASFHPELIIYNRKQNGRMEKRLKKKK